MNCLITKNNQSVSIQFDEWIAEAQIIIESKLKQSEVQFFKMNKTDYIQINLLKNSIGQKFSVEVKINDVIINKKVFE
jgi:hypothetical protein